MKKYADIDYDSFPVADLDLDIHWIQLSRAVTLAKRQAREEALEAQRIAEQPSDHQVILVPADADYAPKETELWPIINYAVLGALKSHETAHFEVMRAIHEAVAGYRGWRNPYPASLEYPDRPIKTRKAA
jgi:hypothetical protein